MRIPQPAHRTRRVLARWAPVAAVAFAFSVAVAACGSAEDGSGAAPRTGAEVYAASCASCHGEDLRGTDEGPSQLSIVYEPDHHPDMAYRSAIVNGAAQHHWGFGPMPPIEGLSDTEIDAVIAFIRSEQERLGFEQ